ncbi:hypothetical protein, partial [Bacteroides cellulosilyticus]|uniref:hypothetical protein n=1 Tax=Bacteroides cellulosilyticus TaxID=246787 RepID=UPI0022E620A0
AYYPHPKSCIYKLNSSNLPSSWLDKIKMRTAKIYVRGTDLFSIDKVDITDPEAIGDVWPATRSIHIGLSLGI